MSRRKVTIINNMSQALNVTRLSGSQLTNESTPPNASNMLPAASQAPTNEDVEVNKAADDNDQEPISPNVSYANKTFFFSNSFQS